MKHKVIWIIAIILLGGYFFAKTNPDNTLVVKMQTALGRKTTAIMTGLTDTGETLPTDLTGVPSIPVEENTQPVMCTMDYTPVCAEVQVQCIKAPCPPIKETFGNTCQMDANKLARFLYTGECK